MIRRLYNYLIIKTNANIPEYLFLQTNILVRANQNRDSTMKHQKVSDIRFNNSANNIQIQQDTRTNTLLTNVVHIIHGPTTWLGGEVGERRSRSAGQDVEHLPNMFIVEYRLVNPMTIYVVIAVRWITVP